MSPFAQPDAMVDRTILNYRILQKLGAGGMGVVYQALDLRLDRIVALKFLSPHLADGPARQRFLQEARAASALDHPNIGTIYGLEQGTDDQFFIVMAYYDGGSLQDLLARGPLPTGRAAELAAQIARGLAAAHAKGIIHRDIKPSNIMLTREGIPKIVDFGLAKLIGGEALTQTGMRTGTAAYMSPEQAMGEEVDGRSDLWSLGVVLYQSISGVLPFHARATPSMLYAIVHESVQPLTGVAQTAQAVVDRALQKDPKLRYQSAGEMLGHLLLLSQSGMNTETQTIAMAAPVPARTNHRQLLIPLMLAAALAIAALVVFLRRQQPAEQRVAVLPFTDAANDPSAQALNEGLVEALTESLSTLRSKPALSVIPASEVRSRKVQDAAAAGKALGATRVITGGIQRNGGNIKLTLEVIDARKDRLVGSASVGNPNNDFAAVQQAAVGELAKLMNAEVTAVTKTPPTAPVAYESYLRGTGYLDRYDRKGNLDQAISAFKEAISRDAQFAPAYAALGKAYWFQFALTKDKADLSAATQNATKAIELDSQLASAYTTLGRIHDSTGQRELAVSEFQRACKLDDHDADAVAGLARAYEKLGRVPEAEELLKRAINLRPDAWEGYSRLGSFYFRQHRLEEAVPQYVRVLNMTPDNVVGYNNLAATYIALRKYADAQKLLEKLLTISPNSYFAYSNLGMLYNTSGRCSDAEAMLNRALKLNDQDYKVWADLADVQQCLAQAGPARNSAQRAMTIAGPLERSRPQDAVLQADLAKLNAILGRKEQAITRVHSAEALSPQNPDIQFELAEAYATMGMAADAIALLKKALQLGEPFQFAQNSPTLRPLLATAKLTQPSIK